jgi:hypothetical protein
MATLDHFCVIGDYHAHGPVMSHLIGSLAYAFSEPKFPVAYFAEYRPEGMATINRKLRKRRARYRRGRESVRPRMRCRR